jgi:hypothetical protein
MQRDSVAGPIDPMLDGAGSGNLKYMHRNPVVRGLGCESGGLAVE